MSSKRDAVLTGIEIILYAGIAWSVWRSLVRDDQMTVVRMRLAQIGEAHCQRKAEVWAHMADACRKTYDTARDVTV